MPIDDRIMDWSGYWSGFETSLYESLTSIEPRYFKLKRDDKYILRERVYCYELYHQLRNNLKDNLKVGTNPLVLQGEIDKSGQEAFRSIYGQKSPNPDFVFHGPGLGEYNFVMMEVKSSSSFNRNNAQKDIYKIEDFINKFGYRHGIFLIFGSINSKGSERDMRRLINELDIDEKLTDDGKLCILWHKMCKCDCEQPVDVLKGSFEISRVPIL